MTSKLRGIAVFLLFLVVVSSSVCWAINEGQIKAVRRKGVLSSSDLETIDRFVAEAVGELVGTRDFTTTGKLRQTILAYSHSRTKSAASQYSDQIAESARNYIPEGFKAAAALEPEDRRFKATVNLLILVDGLKDARLAEVALGMVDAENKIIRYWAVHTVTNPAVAEQLNSTADIKLAGTIVERLKPLVERTNPRIIGLIAEFAARLNIPEGQELLFQIADVRMSKYADWTVKDELLDAAILKLLHAKMTSQDATSPGIARRFCQLYSYAIQRYVKGRDCLDESARHDLASVLVEIEYECVNALLGGMRQLSIKKAVELDDSMALLMEHNKLFGDDTKMGELPVKLDFDFGRDKAGNKLAGPVKLSEPPAELCPAKAVSAAGK